MTKSQTFSQLRMNFTGLIADCGIVVSLGPYVNTVRSKAKCLQLEESIKKQQLICADLQNDLASCREKERELLEFSEKLTSLNVELQATKDNLSIQVVPK